MVCFCLFFYEGGESRAEFPVGQPLCSCDELNYLHVNNNRRILGIDFEFDSRLKKTQSTLRIDHRLSQNSHLMLIKLNESFRKHGKSKFGSFEFNQYTFFL